VHPDFIKPRYGSHCFADLPSTLKYLLTGAGAPSLAPDVLERFEPRYETVILFFIDSFGWRYIEQYGDDYPFLRRLAQEGQISKLTSQFPSTTAAHVTTIHTGLPVGQSGAYEWQYYEPQVDAVIAPLLFSYAGTRQRDTLNATQFAPARLFPYSTFYQDLAPYGVESTIFQHREYTPSTYSDVVFQGARVIPYNTLPEALVNLQLCLAQRHTPAYYFLYFDKIDALSHQYGPSSPQLEAELDMFLTAMDRLFDRKLRGQLSRTLFVMTADHGQIETDPKTTIYLNREARFAGLDTYLETNRNGDLLVPAGSARDFFLYIKDEMLDEAHAFLTERLSDEADVVQTEWLIDAGYFGPPPMSDFFLKRVGNLVVLVHGNKTVWWYEKGKFEQRLHGIHGGLSRQEMEIPLCLYDFAA
jgi:predicted AlkP superfamily pyrophosphatase or phosphodiesterase